MFDDRLYKRGALTLHALRGSLGDAAFFDVLRTWTARYRHGTVSTEEFLVCAEDVGGRPLAALLHRWLHERELPDL
jgi:aminopeptidase